VVLTLQYALLKEFGVAKGAGYSAFLQTLLMSVLFITLLAGRGKREGKAGPSQSINGSAR
jgi:hypothetical protein